MKVSKLKKFDAAEHLRTPEARAEYLSIVLADGDPAEVRDALNLVARAQGMSEVAKAAGVTERVFIRRSERAATRSLDRHAGHRSYGNPPFGSGGGCKAEEARRGVKRVSVAGKEISEKWVRPLLLKRPTIPTRDEPPGRCDARQRHAQRQHDQRDLKPDQTSDFPEDEFHSRPPWRRYGVAERFDAALHETLRARQQLRLLIEGRYDKRPCQDHGERSKRMDFQMIPESGTVAFAQMCHRWSRLPGRRNHDGKRVDLTGVPHIEDRIGTRCHARH